jgi:hypothetical protein
MINVPRVLLPFLFSSLAVALFGCSGADPAPPAGDSASELLAEQAAGTQQETVDPTHTTRTAAVDELGNPMTVCTPREARECRWYYKDGSGHVQCPMSYQLCDVDGSGWKECGLFLLDQSGNIIPRSAP